MIDKTFLKISLIVFDVVCVKYDIINNLLSY